MENRVQIRRGNGAPGFGDLLEYELGYDRISKALYIRNEDGIEIVNSNVIQQFITDAHVNGKNYVRGFIGDTWTINENATAENHNTLVHRGETGVTLDDKSYLTIRFDIGDTYVLSGYVKGTPNLTIELRSLDGSEPRIWTYNVVGDNYEYITEIFEIPAPGDYQLTLGGDGTETEGLYFQKLQIERGEKPTDWRPAPEDVGDLLEKIKEGEMGLDDVWMSVATQGTELTAIQGQITNKVWQTDITQAVDGIEIGGRNLLYNTSDEWTELELSESDYFAQFVHPEVILEVGKTYVFSVIIEKVSDDDAPINIHLGTGTTSYEKDIHEWRLDNIPFGEKVSLVYTIQEEDLGEHAGIFAWRIRNEQQATTVRFKEVKLEKGNKPTGWTTALEDMVEFIDNTTARIEEQVAGLTVSLDGITSEVSTVVTEIDGLREHTETLVQQTSSELSVQITDSLSSLEEDLNQRFQANMQATAEDLLLTFTGFQDSLEGLSEDIANFQTTFRLSSEGLEIGRAEDPFKLLLTNNKMSFLDSGSEVAYVSNRKMFITEAEITNSFKVGNHLIERYNDEITLVRWVG